MPFNVLCGLVDLCELDDQKHLFPRVMQFDALILSHYTGLEFGPLIVSLIL